MSVNQKWNFVRNQGAAMKSSHTFYFMLFRSWLQVHKSDDTLLKSQQRKMWHLLCGIFIEYSNYMQMAALTTVWRQENLHHDLNIMQLWNLTNSLMVTLFHKHVILKTFFLINRVCGLYGCSRDVCTWMSGLHEVNYMPWLLLLDKYP